MKVCIDAQPFVSKRTGVGRYTYALVEAFSRKKLDMDISVFYFNARRNFKDQAMIRKNPRLKSREMKWIPGFVAHKFWNIFSFPRMELFTGKQDLFHFTNFTALPVKKGKVLLTICDATFKRFPKTMEKMNRQRFEKLLEKSMHVSSGIIAISEYTKKELMELFQYPEDRIFVTHLGIDEKFKKVMDIAALEKLKKQYGINGPFILFTGTLEPRKNIPLLIQAFNVLAKSLKHHLVIIGRKGWSYEKILKEIEDSPYQKRIHHLGYVKDHDLPGLYSAADLFVFPSLYEGFGLPPLEAMKCGTPVISSDQASLKEVLRDGAYFFNPYKTDAGMLAEICKEILLDEEKRQAFIKKGESVAGSYLWETTAEKTLEIYKKVGSRSA